MKKYFFLILQFLFTALLYAQKQKADSLSQLLAVEKIDTNKIIYMWQKASYQHSYAPDSAILIAQKGLLLSKQINYVEGESRSLGQMANGFLRLGNNARALEYYIKKLKLEETRNSPYNLASATMNIGIVYVYEEEYDKAVFYLRKADSLITANQLTNLEYGINLNIGDVFDKQNITDSAFLYFSKAQTLAQKMKDQNRIGMAMTGLGHTYLKQHNYSLSLLYYTTGLSYLKGADNEDIICELSLGLADLYQKLNNNDSSIWYAHYCFTLAQKTGFQLRQLDAANFLADLYSKMKSYNDSAFVYIKQSKIINKDINSKQKIRESQIISINEQLRQEEIVANIIKLKKERAQQLQLSLIGLFIPVLFVITLLMSRVKVHARIVRFLGILSLLILFEYLTLLLHPLVVEFTHHTPFFELLIFVTIASLLIPAHHRIEHWLVDKLTLTSKGKPDSIKIKIQRLKFKKIDPVS